MNAGGVRLPWCLVALGVAMFVSGDIVAYNYERFFHTEMPYPSLADVGYLAVYPALIAGMLLLVRRRSPGRDWSSLIDSLIIGSGAAMLSWVLLIAPYVNDPTLSLKTKLISIAYPLMDIVVLTVIVRLAVGSNKRETAFRLVLASMLIVTAADSMYGWKLLHGGYVTGGWLDAGWIAFYVLFAAAALHPSAHLVSEPTPVSARPNRIGRTMVLAGAVLIGPISLAFAGDNTSTRIAVSITSAAVFLLVLDEKVHGLMHEQQRAHAALSRSEEELQRAVRSLEELQHERARLLGDTVNAAEEERMSIAGELHDGPIQEMAALAYTLDVAGLQLGRGDVTSARDAVVSVRTELAAQMNSLRSLMSGLRPPVLDEGGIEAALRDYTTEFARREQIRCSFSADLGDLRLTPEIETTLYRLTQEALSNVARHARANEVRVSLVRDSTSVCLEVEDDGIGFDSDRKKQFLRDGRFGLSGMRERTERADGTWTLDSEPGRGTSIEVVLPVGTSTPAARVVPDRRRSAPERPSQQARSRAKRWRRRRERLSTKRMSSSADSASETSPSIVTSPHVDRRQWKRSGEVPQRAQDRRR